MSTPAEFDAHLRAMAESLRPGFERVADRLAVFDGGFVEARAMFDRFFAMLAAPTAGPQPRPWKIHQAGRFRQRRR